MWVSPWGTERCGLQVHKPAGKSLPLVAEGALEGVSPPRCLWLEELDVAGAVRQVAQKRDPGASTARAPQGRACPIPQLAGHRGEWGDAQGSDLAGERVGFASETKVIFDARIEDESDLGLISLSPI